MSALEWLVRCGVQAGVLTLLVRAGGAKLGVPGPAAAALGALRPGRGPVPDGTVRTFAAVELLVALASAVPVLRAAAAAAVAVLGGCFVVAGLLGAARGAGVPCGCFGTRGTRPLGAASVALGLLFAAAGSAGLLLPAPAPGPTTAAVLLTVTASAAWLLTDHHAHARRVLAAALNRTEATA